MGSLVNSLKRFLGNKNTVTIIGVLVGVVVLYFGYQWRVNQAVSPQSVPYAKQEITSRTKITEEMVGSIEIPKSMVSSSDNLITASSEVINKYVTFGAIIPANSLFYREMLVDQDKMPDSAFADIPDGYTIYSLSVDLHSTYGNSIYPDNYIDLYIKAMEDDNKIIFGKFIESIKVLAVKDAQGQHVFETATESRQPAELLFAVPNNMYSLLMKAGYVTTGNIEIIPVPRNASFSANPGDTQVSSDYIQEFILNQSVALPEEDDENVETIPNGGDTNNQNSSSKSSKTSSKSSKANSASSTTNSSSSKK